MPITNSAHSRNENMFISWVECCLTTQAQTQPPSGTLNVMMTDQFHKSITTGRGSGCCLQRIVRPLSGCVRSHLNIPFGTKTQLHALLNPLDLLGHQCLCWLICAVNQINLPRHCLRPFVKIWSQILLAQFCNLGARMVNNPLCFRRIYLSQTIQNRICAISAVTEEIAPNHHAQYHCANEEQDKTND